MAEPCVMDVDPEALRGLGSSWHGVAQSIGSLDPGGAVRIGSGALPGSATSRVMEGAPEPLTIGIERTAARFTAMAQAARHTADTLEATDEDFAASLGRIDGVR